MTSRSLFVGHSIHGYLARLLLAFMILITSTGHAQTVAPESDYEEISVFMFISGMGVLDVPAYIRDDKLFLPVVDIFSFFKIAVNPSSDYDSISGFFIDPEATYLIDRNHNIITYKGKLVELDSGALIRTETNLYLRSDYLGKIFGLNCTFDFHSLSVTLKTDLELPLIREMKLEQLRKNIRKMKGEIQPDTIIPRNFPGFHFGMTDWGFTASQMTHEKPYNRIDLGFGGTVLGGETNIFLNYNSNTGFDERQQNYYWHFVNNDLKILKQVTVGKISAGGNITLNGPVVGVNVTNTPTTFRRSFCSYILSDYTHPGWIVELYVKNVLVDYIKADASGFFSFEVPLVYGNTLVKLKFYGPWGEQQSRELNINIPFMFVPPKHLEYSLGGGIVEDRKSSRFGRISLNYGFTKWLSGGVGAEYSSTIPTNPVVPMMNISARIASNLMVSGDFMYGVRGRGTLSYLAPFGLSAELNYVSYSRTQQAVLTTYLEDRKLSFSFPFRIVKMPFFLRMNVDQFILPNSSYFLTEFLLSGSVFGISTNLTTFGVFSGVTGTNINSQLSLSYRFGIGLIATGQAQYDFSEQKIIYIKAGLEKNIFRNGNVSLSWEENVASRFRNIQIGLRYDLPFAQTNFTSTIGNRSSSFIESAKGSLMADAANHYVGVNNTASVGKCGLIILGFLDMNCDGKRDPDEPKIGGLNIKVSGGRMVANQKDSSIRIFDLQPFIHYFVELEGTSFNNVSWRLTNKTFRVTTNPNQFRLVEIPVSVFGEAAGMVYLTERGALRGLSRMMVEFFNEKNVQIGKVMTEADGYFSFPSLTPGTYYVRLDPEQLRKLKLKQTGGEKKITIEKSHDGDFATDLDFYLGQEQ